MGKVTKKINREAMPFLSLGNHLSGSISIVCISCLLLCHILDRMDGGGMMWDIK